MFCNRIFDVLHKIRISSILTRTTLAAADDLLAKSSEVEVARVKADLELMECVRRRVKQVAREEGILLDPESEELDQGEQEDSQESQNLLGSEED